MVHDPLSLLDSLMVALSGFVIVFIMLAALWGIIMVVSRVVGSMTKPAPVTAPAAPAAPSEPAPAPLPIVPAIPQVELGKGVEEAQAACIMAIIGYETGIPLNQLIFKSIKVKGEK